MKLTVREYLVLAVIASVAIALRVHGLGMNGLWYDEVFSAEIARMPAVDLVVRTANDVHPPLYYLLLRLWNLLSGSEADGVMRGVSVVLDLLGMGATAFLAWTFFKTRQAVWLTLGFHALSPFAILYAQELRMYSLLILTASISLAMMLRLAEQASARRIAGYVLVTLAALYTHIFAVFMIAAQNAWFLTRRTKPEALTRSRWLLTQVGLGIAFLPWAWVILNQMLWAKGFHSRGTWWIPRPPVKALVGVAHALLGLDWALLGLGGALVLLLCWKVFKNDPSVPVERGQVLACLLFFATPIGLAFAVSWVTTPIFVARFFAETLPALWLLIVAAVLSIRDLRARWALVGVLAVLNVRATFATNYSNAFKAPTPYREIVDELAKESSGQVAVDSSLGTAFAWRWYSGFATSGPANLKTPARCDTPQALSAITVAGTPLFLMWPERLTPPEAFVDAAGRRLLLKKRTNFRELRLVQYE